MSQVVSNTTLSRILLLLIVVAGAMFFASFLVPVLAALIICFASWPIFERLKRLCGGKPTVAAGFAIVGIVLGLVIPLSMAITYTVKEVRVWTSWLIQANEFGAPVPAWVQALPLVGEDLAEQWTFYLGEPHQLGQLINLISGQQISGISRWLLNFGWNAAGMLLTLLFMLITLFFLYRDGEKLADQLDTVGERILPHRWQSFSRVVPATVSATVVGMTLIAIGEGIVLGIAYWIAGVPSPVVFGVLTGFMALIPGGAPLSFSLISLYLIGTGNTVAGIGLFMWGTIELFIVDKTIRPTLIGGPVKLPFLPTFFGLIGGVKTMGFVGLFVGPVLMALLVAIWREWLREDPPIPPAP
ncbi:MAG TPA: AI-2E family transporter [Pseudohongiella sp.]|nr:AI-2E family transporter [Pseudohongiella sp.]